jgi:hypothetical protein
MKKVKARSFKTGSQMRYAVGTKKAPHWNHVLWPTQSRALTHWGRCLKVISLLDRGL